MINKFGYKDAIMLGYIMKEEELAMKMLRLKGEEYDASNFKFRLNMTVASYEFRMGKNSVTRSITRLIEKGVIEFDHEDRTIKILWKELKDTI